MTSDREMLALLRLAREAEDFDRAADAPAHATPMPASAPRRAGVAAQHQPHEPRRTIAPAHRPWRTLAMAASLTLVSGLFAWGVSRWSSPAPAPTPPGPIAVGPRAPSPAKIDPPAPSADGSVVLAIAQSAEGEVECVRWTDHEFTNGRRLDQIDPSELRDVGLALSCRAAPHRLLVVGLQGPANQLPRSDDQALQMARCMLASGACRDSTFSPVQCAASGCAGPTLAVKIEPVAFGR
jgi:hypothetical protein